MSEERPARGGDDLLSLAQIKQRFGVSRTTIHGWRARGDFPDPEPTPGSTRLRWRESAVARFMENNPKRQGARTDLKSPGESKEGDGRSA
ncbi:helix-turn-helix transcriptional regulator [Streptomyces inusitatus]